MSKREKFLAGWSILAALVVIFSTASGRQVSDIIAGVLINVVVWYWFWKFIFWLYDKFTKKPVIEEEKRKSGWVKLVRRIITIALVGSVALFMIGYIYGTLRVGYFHQLPPLSSDSR